MELTIEDFPGFFRSVNDECDPFRWQVRLAERLVETGMWPDRLVAPTGAGKTSCIDIHVFAVAMTAGGGNPVRPPRRLAMIVDRRVLVDDQHRRAVRLREQLEDPQASGVVARVAQVLRGLRTGGDEPGERRALVVTRLRGGQPPPWSWRSDPSACAVICATPDMWGSRLLLRGYGSRATARPREAGLLAVDAAAVVDEAHLSNQLLVTARRVAELERDVERRLGIPRLQVVETSATPTTSLGSQVGVEVEDLDHDDALRARLATPKPLRLLPLAPWPLADRGSARTAAVTELVDEVVRLRERFGPTVGCFANTVRLAGTLAEALRAGGLTVSLVCGRLRPHDLAEIERRHPHLLDVGGNDQVDVLVSTQSLEVGVDIDLSAMVTELAPGTALAQRAGRVNRRGGRAGCQVVVAIPADGAVPDEGQPPYTAEDLRTALCWLQDRSRDPAGLAPLALRSDPPPAARLRRRVQRLEPWDDLHLARTSARLAAEPDLALWLSDDLDPVADAGVAVRRDLFEPPDEPGQRPLVAAAALRALAPRAEEVFPVRIALARSIATRLRAEERPFAVVDAEGGVSDGDEGPDLVAPGAVLVLDSAATVFRSGVVDLDGQETAQDVCELSAPRDAGGSPQRLDLRLGSRAPLAEQLDPTDVERFLLAATELELDTRDGRDELGRRLRELAGRCRDEAWTLHLRHVASALRLRLADFACLLLDADVPEARRLIIADLRRRRAEESVQVRGVSDRPVHLRDHNEAVADRAALLAERIGLLARVSDVLRLAGAHHDDGKADPRFQVRLGRDPAAEDQQLRAKSGMQRHSERRAADARSGLPAVWRHEQLSAALAWPLLCELPEADRRLVVRLIGTSHGWGRGSFPHTAHELVPAGSTYCGAVAELFRDGLWEELVEATDQELGVWGAAYLEALLQAADGQVSGEGR